MTIIPTPSDGLAHSHPDAFDSEHQLQADAAARRLAGRIGNRSGNEDALARGDLAGVDSPARITNRLARIAHYYDPALATTPEPTIAMGIDRAATALAVQGADLERIINAADFLAVRYLDDGVSASRSIGRVNIDVSSGQAHGFGTGFLVAPSLLLTNHHVLPDAETARTSQIEFNYQDGPGGAPLSDTKFRFAPDRFFLADRQRDFALVAVDAPLSELAPFGYNRLTAAQGTVIIGEYVTIVQHPGGRKKQIVLRENKLIDIPEGFVHYSADTEPGSSGSPVFNDQWEVVALHHASVPVAEDVQAGGYLNEGIRISSILAHLRSQPLTADQLELAAVLLGDPPPTTPAVAPQPDHSEATSAGTIRTVTVPVEITVRLTDTLSATAQVMPAETSTSGSASTEAISIDPDYTTRGGYDPNFLTRPVPLPTPTAAVKPMTSQELRYHHFSVVMNRPRRMALFTAVNIDGSAANDPPRESDRWIRDPRIGADEQTDEALYRDNPLDRGHLVRRLDPAWGPRAKAANDDTFHFTNCTPQHHDFNAGATLWVGLEDYLLRSAQNNAIKVNVLTGPVFADDDPPYRGFKLPKQFWKVATMVKVDGTLSATGYLLSQQALLDEFSTAPEAFSFGAYRTYQVQVRRIAAATGLDLSAYIGADPLEHIESSSTARELIRTEDLIL
ncbi:DNA/RNA non-specific endonuclease [Nocardia sp. 348MFTsu5.1]|uniref:DNA/RNA non-specific endonuclease n=1 Tax=Nocardia sp. 348MFTsu5.1 TaxID=1172185 RepID=UPI00035F0BE6|nr:DNA/RNA non-specific endonuclease [Nocardia sp. 348MFTsu5.1]